MKLEFVQVNTPEAVRSLYVLTPDSDPAALWKSSAVTVLRDGGGEDSVRGLIEEWGLEYLVEEQKCFFLFPNPTASGWNYELREDGPRDADFITALNFSLNSGEYTGGWRAINDVHYLMGVGDGASLVHTLVSDFPAGPLAAAVCTVGGALCPKALEKAVSSPVPAVLLGAGEETAGYYLRANGAVPTGEKGLYACPYNLSQRVYVSEAPALTQGLMREVVWEKFFRRIRRTNTTEQGDVDRRIVPEECDFVWHLDDTRLGDNGCLGHDWLEHIPSCVREHPERKVPLMIFGHGMSDNPLKAADMIKFHELGEREGFITVYTFSSNRFSWNLSLSEEGYDDVAYYCALLEYLKKTYPVDETRVYVSGFSNGAGMSMTFAMLHPELVAAICPVDSAFPYAGIRTPRPGAGPQPYITPVKPGTRGVTMPLNQDREKNLAPMRLAMEHQAERAYQMPVMYFYGTRESEYPIADGSDQQIQYDFWKKFNGIPVKPTVDSLEPDAVGVPGDRVEEFYPSPEHPDHKFSRHVFLTPAGEDYYHLVLMHGKAHEIHPVERELAWAFVSRFSRNADGSLWDSGAREEEKK